MYINHNSCELQCYCVIQKQHIVCPRSLDLIYKVTYYMKWVKTSWIYSKHGHNIYIYELPYRNHSQS